jgi:hypothetical protein
MIGRRMGRPGLLGMAARTAVVAGTATAVSGGVRRRADSKAAASEAPQEQEAPQAMQEAPAAAPMSVEDQVARIKALGGLKEQGLLTDEEFTAEKAKVLAM